MAFKGDTRKSLAQLIAEKDEYRGRLYKVFRHNKSGDRFQLLSFVFDERTNIMQCVYSLVALSWLKFVCPATDFWAKFTQERDTTAVPSHPIVGPDPDGAILSPVNASGEGLALGGAKSLDRPNSGRFRAF